MHDILWILGLGLVAYGIAALIGQWRKGGGTFDDWWDSEGFVFFVVIGMALAIGACGFGVFQFKVNY